MLSHFSGFLLLLLGYCSLCSWVISSLLLLGYCSLLLLGYCSLVLSHFSGIFTMRFAGCFSEEVIIVFPRFGFRLLTLIPCRERLVQDTVLMSV